MNAFLAKRDSGNIWTEEETTTFIQLYQKKTAILKSFYLHEKSLNT